MSSERHASQIAECGHVGRRPPNGGGEWRQINLVHGPGGHIHGAVIAPGRDHPISGEMLGGGGNGGRPAKARPLKPADFCFAEAGTKPGVFAGAFHHAAPARIARHIEHRRKSERYPGRFCLDGGCPRRCLPKVWVHRGGFRKRHRKDNLVAVQHVQREQERNAKARLFKRDLLQLAETRRVLQIEDAARPPACDLGLVLADIVSCPSFSSRLIALRSFSFLARQSVLVHERNLG